MSNAPCSTTGTASISRRRPLGWRHPRGGASASDGHDSLGADHPAACAPPVSADGGMVYPGIFRTDLADGRAARGWRLRLSDHEIWFDDRVHGRARQNLERAGGDVILLRADEHANIDATPDPYVRAPAPASRAPATSPGSPLIALCPLASPGSRAAPCPHSSGAWPVPGQSLPSG